MRLLPLAFVIALSLMSKASLASPFSAQLQEGLRARVESGRDLAWTVGRDDLYTRTATHAMYTRRGFAPIWIDGPCPAKVAGALRDHLDEAPSHGLGADAYHLLEIDQHLVRSSECRKGSWAVPEAIELELLLTDAFFLYSAHLIGGRVDPTTLDPEWQATKQEVDLVALLETVAAGRRDIGSALDSLLPVAPQYQALRMALKTYRRIEGSGGWPTLTEAEASEEEKLRERLVRQGFAADQPRDAVIAFQECHGLPSTGVVDGATLAELNVPASARVQQLELALERWRWLPRVLGERHVFVNIPAFALRAIDRGKVVLDMRAIVGKPYRRTPMLSSKIRYIVLSPTWTVPPTVLRKDLLPKMKRDRSFLSKSGMTLYEGWGTSAKRVDPKSIKWAKVTPSNFRYRVVQSPGPKNALGRVKIMFANEFAVYIHDTPSKELFGESSRSFSSGCIRAEAPLELAAWLLRDPKGWNLARLEKESRRASEKTILLPAQVDVHLAYLTAWVDAKGQAHFRRDIYQRDAGLAKALSRHPAPQ